jgi:hypothetical protein
MEEKIKNYSKEIERMEAMENMENELNKPVNSPIVTRPLKVDNEVENKGLNSKPNIRNTIPKKVTVSKLSKIRTGDTDYEDIINKLFKIVGELSCRETSGNCNSSNGWSDLCNAGIKLFNKLK